MKVYVGGDHGGFELKEQLKPYLENLGHEVIDLGNTRLDPDDDYPDFVMPVAKAVNDDPEAVGVIFGRSGQGEAIAANKYKKVRAFTFYGPVLPKKNVDAAGRKSTDPFENVKLSRVHNHTNVISLGGVFLSLDDAKKALKLWLETPYDTQDRYSRRIKQVEDAV